MKNYIWILGIIAAAALFSDLTQKETEAIMSEIRARHRLSKIASEKLRETLREKLPDGLARFEQKIAAQACATALKNGLTAHEAVHLADEAGRQYRQGVENGRPKKDAASGVLRACQAVAVEWGRKGRPKKGKPAEKDKSKISGSLQRENKLQAIKRSMVRRLREARQSETVQQRIRDMVRYRIATGSVQKARADQFVDSGKSNAGNNEPENRPGGR